MCWRSFRIATIRVTTGRSIHGLLPRSGFLQTRIAISSPAVHNAGIPRGVETAIALGGLLIVAPILGLSAIAIRATSPGPILFRQTRVGRGGRHFEILKLRTMVVGSGGPGVTARDDKRVTEVGRFLRKSKLDELPELWNVLCGDMALVGPRPEIPRYVDVADPLWREVLEVLPGLTDPNGITLRNEEEVLASLRGNRERFYLHVVQRYKLLRNVDYQRRRTCWTDVKLVLRTVVAVLLPSTARPPTADEIERFVKERTASP